MSAAFELGFRRMYGLSVPTYESGSLRRFHHGRTDTIRSCSQESVAFCRVAVDEHVPTSEKTRLLRLAISAHSKYTEKVCASATPEAYFTFRCARECVVFSSMSIRKDTNSFRSVAVFL
jgi:hypothetical protein